MRDLVRVCVPEGATVVVASRGDPCLVDHPARTAWHFPQTGDGVYAGHHPATSDDAVGQLGVLHERGAGFFLLPASAGWWLDHYTGLRDWLSCHATLVAYQEGAGTLWRLHRQPAGQAACPNAVVEVAG